jgi:hypothetical protein
MLRKCPQTHFGIMGSDGRIMLKLISKKQGVKMWVDWVPPA